MKKLFITILLCANITGNFIHGMKHDRDDNNQIQPLNYRSLFNVDESILYNVATYLGLYNANKFVQTNKELYYNYAEENQQAIIHKKQLWRSLDFVHERIKNGNTNIVNYCLSKMNKDQKNTALNSTEDLLYKTFGTIIPSPSIDPFILAAYNGNATAIRKLLSQEKIYQNIINKAFSVAVVNGHTDVVRLLLTQNTIINAISEDTGRTHLMIAIDCGHIDTAGLLINKGANVNIIDKNNNNALIIALNKKNFDIVKLLINKNANVNIANKSGITPLMFVSYHGRADCVRLLIAKDANINTVTIDGRTALMIASSAGHMNIVKLLLKKGADVYITTKDDKTALSIATEKNHTKIVKLLEGHIKKQNKKNCTNNDKQSQTKSTNSSTYPLINLANLAELIEHEKQLFPEENCLLRSINRQIQQEKSTALPEKTHACTYVGCKETFKTVYNLRKHEAQCPKKYTIKINTKNQEK